MTNPSSGNHVGYSQQTFVGMLAVASTSLVGKVSSFLAQLILGRVLAERDFELWAMACVANTLIAGLRSGGAGRIIVQNGLERLDKIRAISEFCWLLNLLAAAVLLIAAPFASQYFDESEVTGLMGLMAIAVTLNAPLTVGRARMSLHMRFKEMALIDAILNALQYGLMVALACFGFGAKSFIIPQIVTNIVGHFAFRQKLGPIPAGPHVSKSSFLGITIAAKWLILAAFASSLAMTGDYMLLGRYARSHLANYFFGYQLTLSLSVLFAPAMQQVMMPTFSRLNQDAARQASAYLRSVKLTAFVAGFTCIAMAAVAPPLVSLAWSGKWDEAIPVIQIMSLSIMLRILNPLAFSLLQSQGRWATYAAALILESVLVLMGTWIGISIGGLVSISISVAIFRSILPIATTCYAGVLTGLPIRTIGIAVSGRVVPLLATAGLQSWISTNYSPESIWFDLLSRALLVIIAYAILAPLFFRKDIGELVGVLRARSSSQQD